MTTETRTPQERLEYAKRTAGPDGELWEMSKLLREHRGWDGSEALVICVDTVMHLARCHASWLAGIFTWSRDDPRAAHAEIIEATGHPSWEEHEQRLLRIVSYNYPKPRG